MPAVIGGGLVVVEAPGLKITELAGNVATKDGRVSIATVKAAAGTEEPWLTIQYDEWICITSGSMKFEFDDGKNELLATTGQTVFIAKGTRFHPSFPEDAEYIPVCLPAFSPETCIREDGEDSTISAKLQELHAPNKTNQCQSEEKPEVLYHMCPKSQWEDAKTKGEAYYPESYVADGHYTHATGVPKRLIETANHFYTDSEGDWICLEFTRTSLRKIGIFVRDEEAMPVGDKKVSDDWLEQAQNWICPHVIGGIPVIDGIVQKEYPMQRSPEGKFLGITGVTGQ